MTSKTLSVTLGAALLALAGAAAADSEKLLNPANRHTYQRFDDVLEWGPAKTDCEGRGGYLATLTSQAENDWVADHIMPGNPDVSAFAGGYIDAPGDPWGHWVTGEDWSYTHWFPGEPNNLGGMEVVLEFANNGYWNDMPNTASLPHICEWSPRHLEIAVIFRPARPPAGAYLIQGFTITDYALLAAYGDTYYLHLLNGYTGQIVASTLLGSAPAVTPKGITVTDHMGRALVTVLINQADGSSISRVYDATTDALLRTIELPR